MTLYRKYRPQTIEELDLALVREQMQKLSANLDKMPHAFLFAGPRGAGKTSAARILAKLVNCENPQKTKYGFEPCNKCDQCKAITDGQSMDVIELDTASNRGIDDIRALRENITLSPAHAKKKVYIMDEAHMLTVEAANAFLKTLEEPPSHALFILATTDPHKLPETVRSRATLVSFTKANNEEIKRQLSRIIAGEKLKVEEEVADLISNNVDGSFREAVKILESLSLNTEITKEIAEAHLFSSNALRAEELVELLFAKNTSGALSKIRAFADSGGSIKDLIDQAQEILRSQMIQDVKNGEDATESISLIKLLMEAKSNIGKSASSELPLEIAIIEWGNSGKKDEPAPAKKRGLPAKAEPKVMQAGKKKAEKLTGTTSSIDAGAWSEVLQKTRTKNATLEAVLRTARPVGVDGNTLNLAVYYQFHKERLEVDQYRKLVESVVGEVLGLTPARLVCVLEDPPSDMVKKSEPKFESLTVAPAPDIIQAAKEIFGE